MKTLQSAFFNFIQLLSWRPTTKSDIYCRSTKPRINTSSIFEFREENQGLRVFNKNINCLYHNLTKSAFDLHYNDLRKYLNLNYSSLNYMGQIEARDIEVIEEKLITHWIYFYVVNRLKVKVRRFDFVHPNNVDVVQDYLIKKGIEKDRAIIIGSTILRTKRSRYSSQIDFSEWYSSIK